MGWAVARAGELLQSVLKLPGNKIVTLVVQGREPFVIDIGQNGDVGYEKGHELVSMAKLVTAFRGAGALMIRQFLPLRVQRVVPNGKTLWIPRKNVYGIRILGDKWEPLSGDEVRLMHTTDADTGQALPPEDDVRYADFPYLQAST